MLTLLQEPQKEQQVEASIARPSQEIGTEFAAVQMLGVNSSPTNGNLLQNFPPTLNDLGSSGISKQVMEGGGGVNREASRTRKRGRSEVDEENSKFLQQQQQQQVQISADVVDEDDDTSSKAFLSSPIFNDVLDSDLSVRMQTDLLELDRFISLQMERVRAEVEQKKKGWWTTMVRAAEVRLQRALRAKDHEIASMARVNSTLVERVNTLATEGQMWKTIARTHETASAALRRDVELARRRAAAALLPDGDGCSGGVEAQDSVSRCEGWSRREEGGGATAGAGGRYCRGCRWNEASVLVLPCRHLCLCGECNPKTDTCPICGVRKSANITVYFC